MKDIFNTKNFEHMKIQDYKYWRLYLHECQSYIGRVYLLNNNTKASDFIELPLDEREEFFQIGVKIKMTLKDLFFPDKMNYAALSNVFEKLHVHFIPRYKTKRIFEGIEFVDTRWGQNYAPYEKSFQISFDIQKKLIYKIRENLTRQT